MTQAFQVWCWKPPLVILVFLVTHIVLVALFTHIVLVALVTLATLVTLVILVLWSSWSSGHPGQPSLPRQPGRPGHPGHPHHSVTPLLHQHFQPCYTLLHPITPCLEMWNGLFFVISQQPINEIANWFHYLVCQILHSILVLIGWGICPRFGEGSQ